MSHFVIFAIFSVKYTKYNNSDFRCLLCVTVHAVDCQRINELATRTIIIICRFFVAKLPIFKKFQCFITRRREPISTPVHLLFTAYPAVEHNVLMFPPRSLEEGQTSQNYLLPLAVSGKTGSRNMAKTAHTAVIGLLFAPVDYGSISMLSVFSNVNCGFLTLAHCKDDGTWKFRGFSIL